MQATTTRTYIRVRIEHDDCPVDPIGDWDGQWSFYQFNDRTLHAAHPESLGMYKDEEGDLCVEDFELTIRLAAGLAFPIRYSEHGLCRWDIAYDVSDCDGMVIWENPIDDMGAQSIEDRRKDAQQFLDVYTDWCNGSVYGYVIEKVTEEDDGDEDEEIDSCWGFYGSDSDYMREQITSSIKHAGCQSLKVEYAGDAAWIAD